LIAAIHTEKPRKRRGCAGWGGIADAANMLKFDSAAAS
jgi:hypothetical protein